VKHARTIGALCVAWITASGLAAQVADAGQNTQPAWLEAWSPLEARAELPRRLPWGDAVPASLLLPASRVGVFWTAGNPAGLRDELDDTRTDFALALGRESGTLRRPLDPGTRSGPRTSGIGWAPVDSRLALLGRVVFDQERFDPGAHADDVDAYSSSPFVTLDTSTTATRRTRARLEGALSVHLTDWALGLALGYEAREHETIESGFVRRTRQTIPGATIGVTRRFGSLRFGPYARWRNRAETILLIEREEEGLVIQLEGLREVQPLEILSLYYRRIEEDIPSIGWSVAGSLGGGTWSLYAERSWLWERLTRQEADNPAEDRWDARAWSAGGAFQRRVGRRSLVTVTARYSTLRGDGDLALDSTGVIFRAAERAFVGTAELRVLPDTAGWSLVVGVQVRLEHRLRDALTVPIAAEVTGLTSGVSVEVGRALSRRLFATATVGFASYSANSSFPSPALGPVYRSYLLPEYDLASRPAQSWLGAIGVRWMAGPQTSLWIRATGEVVSPSKPGPTSFGPDGSRSTIGTAAGVTLTAN
jgi:uncharacterized protein DUF6850